jgi:hypothetical protein
LGLQSFDVGPYAPLPAPLLTPLLTARFELGRRRAALSHVRGEELDDIATRPADDGLMAVLAKLDEPPWREPPYDLGIQFALLEAGVRLRRRAWQNREVVLDRERWGGRPDPASSASSRSRARTPTPTSASPDCATTATAAPRAARSTTACSPSSRPSAGRAEDARRRRETGVR